MKVRTIGYTVGVVIGVPIASAIALPISVVALPCIGGAALWHSASWQYHKKKSHGLLKEHNRVIKRIESNPSNFSSENNLKDLKHANKQLKHAITLCYLKNFAILFFMSLIPPIGLPLAILLLERFSNPPMQKENQRMGLKYRINQLKV